MFEEAKGRVVCCWVTLNRHGRSVQSPLCAKSGPSLTITKQASHPVNDENESSDDFRYTPTADIVGHRGHVRKVPDSEVCCSHFITENHRTSADAHLDLFLADSRVGPASPPCSLTNCYVP
jgi:hypothetical protein